MVVRLAVRVRMRVPLPLVSEPAAPSTGWSLNPPLATTSE
jgi:hypothetical protein